MASPSAVTPPELSRLLAALGPRRADLEGRLGAWLCEREEGKKALHTMEREGLSPGDTAAALARLAPVYLSAFSWISHLLAEKKRHENSTAANGTAPLLVAISAPQGCGKTALTDALKFLFDAEKTETVSLSLDTFYALASKQEKLAGEHPDNPLLQGRGNPGTHEPLLAACVLDSLKRNAPNGEVQVPVYDKSLNGGRGDRLCVAEWSKLKTGGIELILFEGWLLGYKSFSDATEETMPSLSKDEREWMKPINKSLKQYEEIDALVDAWLILQVDDLQRVYGWRLEQEQALKASSGSGMSDEEVKAFVDRSVPAYKAYLPRLSAEGPSRAAASTPVFEILLGAGRRAEKAKLVGFWGALDN
ncbi:glycerate kinase [Besnoitia besnoiti]|uniref:Glycerate kinase n=1 Tax=Besnoitia besnoiti TaxID=94643 RepID=A0A2A9M4H1_BESBE|nr:glycerate kinase [Besnoitia besnoiti]PFH32865.1 glycerate kinase [Besnoitia besnoiti]